MNYLNLSPEYIARVTDILTRPMTAIEFADLFWPERVKKVKQPGKRSRAGHALLNTLARGGIVQRKKNKNGAPDTFVVASAQREDYTFGITPTSCYWVLLLRGKNWGWLGPNDQMCELTQNPAQRSRYSKQADAMTMLWHFRKLSPERGKAMRLVRVSVRTP